MIHSRSKCDVRWGERQATRRRQEERNYEQYRHDAHYLNFVLGISCMAEWIDILVLAALPTIPQRTSSS